MQARNANVSHLMLILELSTVNHVIIPAKNVLLPHLEAAQSVMLLPLELLHRIVLVYHLTPIMEFNYAHFVRVVNIMIAHFYHVSRVIPIARYVMVQPKIYVMYAPMDFIYI